MLSDSLIHYDSCLLYHIRIQNLQVMHLGIPKKEQKISRVPWGKKKKKKNSHKQQITGERQLCYS